MLAKRPTGDPIVVGATGAGDIDQLVDPTTYLIIRNALFNKATRAYADEWQVNLPKQQTIRPDWARFDFMLLPTTPTIYKLAEVRGGPAQVVPGDPNSDFLGSPTGGYADPIAGTPTNAQLASRARANTELNTRLGTYTNFANILQTSALALPAGFRSKAYGGTPVNDLPFGVTLFADTLKDCTLFPVAEAYEAQLAEDLGLWQHRK